MNPYDNYINKYGFFYHILNININDELCYTEKNIIISTIYDKINGKKIIKNILGMDFPLIWRVSNENDLLHYYTNGCGLIMSDYSIYVHTKTVLNEIKQIIGENKFSFMITKPITEKICIM